MFLIRKIIVEKWKQNRSHELSLRNRNGVGFNLAKDSQFKIILRMFSGTTKMTTKVNNFQTNFIKVRLSSTIINDNTVGNGKSLSKKVYMISNFYRT